MKTNKTQIVAACLVAIGLGSSAYASPEQEVNNSIAEANVLTGASSHAVEGLMSNDDLDFYTFDAKAGDVLDLDIDNGVGGTGSIDSVLAIFDDAGNMLRMNAYSDGLDAGSTSIADARIDKFVAPASGRYSVGVSTVPRYFTEGGNVMSFSSRRATAGDYTLNISGITIETTKQINIEVKPGVKEMAPLNPRSKGKVPVAIMGAADFTVADINQDTLTFGSTGGENSLSKCQPQLRDINQDGYVDQLCHFENSDAGFQGGDIEGVLQGSLKDGTNFEGRALLKVVPTSKM